MLNRNIRWTPGGWEHDDYSKDQYRGSWEQDETPGTHSQSSWSSWSWEENKDWGGAKIEEDEGAFK